MNCLKCGSLAITLDIDFEHPRVKKAGIGAVAFCCICGKRYYEDPITHQWTAQVMADRKERELPLHKVKRVKRPYHRSLGI